MSGLNVSTATYRGHLVTGAGWTACRGRTGCRFSFTCTGKRNAVKEREEWATAVKLAKQVIADEVWLDDVGSPRITTRPMCTRPGGMNRSRSRGSAAISSTR